MLLQMSVLARLLAPSDFGLMALITATIAFVQVFSDMGISTAIIHHQKISQEALSTLYWINVLASAVLMLLLILLSPFIAEWYHEPRMQMLLVLVSFSFLISALGQQLRVMAEKNLHFQPLAIIDLAASLIGFAVSVSVAYTGGGVFALVAGMLCNTLVTSALSWLILSKGWRPLLRLKLSDAWDFLSAGAYMMGFSLTNTFNIQMDILIGGRMLGGTSLGAYSMSKDVNFRLAMIINPIVTRVGFPVMSKAQDDKALLKSIYLKTLRMTSSVNFPLYIMIAVFSPEIVRIMFGTQWQESVPLLRILALWGLVRSTGNPVGSLVMAIGRTKWMFWWNFIQMLLWTPIFWTGAKYGAEGLAVASLVSMSASNIIFMWYALIRPACGAKFIEYITQLTIPFIISLITAIPAFYAAYFIEWTLLQISKGLIIGGFKTNEIVLQNFSIGGFYVNGFKIEGLYFQGFQLENFIVAEIVYSILRLGIGIVVGGMVYLVLSRWLNRTWFNAITELLLRRVSISANLKI